MEVPPPACCHACICLLKVLPQSLFFLAGRRCTCQCTRAAQPSAWLMTGLLGERLLPG